MMKGFCQGYLLDFVVFRIEGWGTSVVSERFKNCAERMEICKDVQNRRMTSDFSGVGTEAGRVAQRGQGLQCG